MQIETFARLIQNAGIALPEVPKVSRRRASVSAFGVSGSGTAPYDAAGSGKRLAGWNPTSAAVNELLSASGDDLRRKVRQLVRNNAWAANAIDSFVGEAIGTGVTPSSLHPDPAIKAAIEDAWLRWTDEADASGRCDFYGLESLVCRSMMEGGEAFTRLRPRLPKDGLSVPLQLQILESDYCPATKTEPAGGGGTGGPLNYIQYGIEFDAIRRRAAYHLYRQMPGSNGFDGQTNRYPSWEYDTVRGTLHIYRMLQASMDRGQPWFTPILLKLHDLDEMDDAVLGKTKLVNFFALFIKRNTNADSATGVFNETADSNGDAQLVLEPNTLQYLGLDEEVQEVTGGKFPGSDYDAYVRNQLRAIAAVFLGMPYYLLSGDLTDVNFSSIRAGMLAFRRKLEQFIHQVIVYQFCRPIWISWMDAAVLSGALNLPGYAEDPTPYRAVEWSPQAWPWVDPVNDVEAAALEVRNGFASRSQKIAERGGSRTTVDKQQAEDNASADGAGVKYDSDARNPKNGGQQQQGGKTK